MLQETFENLVGKYTTDKERIQQLWREIEQAYTHRKRHYHNLDHLQHLLKELEAVKAIVHHWEAIALAVYYHDIVYNARKNDNEETSARLAVNRLSSIGVPPHLIDLCAQHILATKQHIVSEENDTNLFTDADLSILGQEPVVYKKYLEGIRNEYAIYPDLLYRPGRKKVLHHFINMPAIFKTDWFAARYEQQARENLKYEINEL